MSLQDSSLLMTRIRGPINETYQKLCSDHMLKEFAKHDPEIQANLDAEDAQTKSIEGCEKRRRSIEDEETHEERTLMRQVKMSAYRLAIADNMAKIHEATARAQEATAGAKEATARAGKVVLDHQTELITGLPDTPLKEKAFAYMNIQKTNLSMRLCEQAEAKNCCPMLTQGEVGMGMPAIGMEMPDILQQGGPLMITSVLAEKGFRDTDKQVMSKAVGVIVSRLYRAKHDKEPTKSTMILDNGRPVTSNAYLEVDRDILEQAVDEYTASHDVSSFQSKKQKKKEARDKEARTQTKLNYKQRDRRNSSESE